MAEKAEIIIEAVDKASKTLANVKKQVQGTKDAVDESSKGFSAATKSLLKYASGFATIGAATKFLQLSISEAVEGQQVHAQLQRQVEAAGISWFKYGGAISSAVESSKTYGRVTTTEVEATLKRMVLLSGDVSGSMKNLNLVMDLSTAAGIDLSSSADLVARAMGGETMQLARLFPELRQQIEAMDSSKNVTEKAARALTLLRERTEGATQAIPENVKKVQEFKSAWSEFAEAFGNTVLPVLGRGLTVVTAMLKGFSGVQGELGREVKITASALNEWATTADAVTRAHGMLGTGVKVTVTDTQNLTSAGAQLVSTLNAETAASLRLVEAQAKIPQSTRNVISEYDSTAAKIEQLKASYALYTEEQIAADMKMLETKQLVNSLIGQSQDALKLKTLQKIMEEKDAATKAQEEELGVSTTVATAKMELVGSLFALGRTLGAKSFAATRGLGIAESLINSYRAFTTVLADPKIPTPVKPALAGIYLAMGLAKVAAIAAVKPPKMAEGGIVTSPTIAMIGEAGPEAVIPLDRSQGFANVNVNFSGPVMGNQQQAREFAMMIDRELRELRDRGKSLAFE